MKTFYDFSAEQDQNEGFWKGALAGAALGASALPFTLTDPAIDPPAIVKHDPAHNVPAPDSLPAPAKSIPTKEPIARSEGASSTEAKYFADYIGQSEGRRSFMYLDSNGFPTIGIGHLLTPQSRLVFKYLFGLAVDYIQIMNKQQGLSSSQIDKLFEYDMQKHLKRTKQIFPDFDTYPIYLKAALLDGVYRGEYSPEHTTVKLINSGKFKEAAAQYLLRKDYNQAIKSGKSRGIISRMNRNQLAMLRYAKEN
jgi:GH24 family phage-related lysozyme (muramidase)